MRREILENPRVQDFLAAHANELSYDSIERNLPKLQEFISQSTVCCGCDNTDRCTNYLKVLFQLYVSFEILLKWIMCVVSKKYVRMNAGM